MKDSTKQQVSQSVKDFRFPRYNEIPNVGLYLEQATKYVGEYLAPLGEYTLTPSMISNYVKKGLIPAPVKKQYFPEQIAYLFFVAMAKNLMSMENIDLLISVQRSTYTLPVAYDYMCRELENMLFYFFGLKDAPEDVGETESDEKNLLRGLIMSAANVIYLNNYIECVRQQKQE